MRKKYNNNSNYYADWTTEKLKQEAKNLYDLIHEIECYGLRDIKAFNQISLELKGRGIKMSYKIQFNK